MSEKRGSRSNLRQYPRICLEGMRNTSTNLSQDSWDLNPGLQEYEASDSTDHSSVRLGTWQVLACKWSFNFRVIFESQTMNIFHLNQCWLSYWHNTLFMRKAYKNEERRKQTKEEIKNKIIGERKDLKYWLPNAGLTIPISLMIIKLYWGEFTQTQILRSEMIVF